MIPKKSLFSCIHFSTCASKFWGAVSPMTPLFLCRLNPTLPNSPIPTSKPRPVSSDFGGRSLCSTTQCFPFGFRGRGPWLKAGCSLCPLLLLSLNNHEMFYPKIPTVFKYPPKHGLAARGTRVALQTGH